MSAAAASGPVRVVVVDGHVAVRAALERVLGRAAGLEPVAALGDDAAVAALHAREPVHAVLLDVDLEGGDGLAACQRLKALPEAPAVVLYSAYAGPSLAYAAAVARADALVGKAEPVGVLLEALRRCAAGERLLAAPGALARSLGIDPRDAVARAHEAFDGLTPVPEG